MQTVWFSVKWCSTAIFDSKKQKTISKYFNGIMTCACFGIAAF